MLLDNFKSSATFSNKSPKLVHDLQEKTDRCDLREPEYQQQARSGILVLIVPGVFSVTSILLQGMGLQYISASLSMMLSGSCVIFTAVLSIVLLKRRLNAFHITGQVDHRSSHVAAPICCMSGSA